MKKAAKKKSAKKIVKTEVTIGAFIGAIPSEESLDAPAGLLERLGRYKTGKRCLYIARLDAADADALA